MSEPDILLTRNNGIGGIGFHAPYDALSELANMAAVAPATNQNMVGRKMSADTTVTGHELGHALEGAPADCTAAGLGVLCPDIDMITPGINRGANTGACVLSRSGTVSAAAKAAFFGVSVITLSLYVPASDDLPWHEEATDPRDFRETTNAVSHLIKRVEPADVFERYNYPNISAPVSGPDGGPTGMQVMIPSGLYDMTTEFENGTVKLHDRAWERAETGDIPDPDGTDRWAVVEGRVSVSPLITPHTAHQHETLDILARAYLE